jgi:RimJ/RimL family protein N-acetyltransferase
LLVVACPLAVAESLGRDGGRAEQLLGARIPDDWPDTELAGILPPYAAALREDPALLGYGIWLLVDQESGTVVGSAGFLGRPTADATIEIGYGVHHAHRNRGYATEAVRALVGWALGRPGITRVIARCEPANIASARVLAKAGLEETGEVGGLSRWATP